MTKLPIIGYPNLDKFDFFRLSKSDAKKSFQEFKELIPERVKVFSDLINHETLKKYCGIWSVDRPTEENLLILFDWLVKNISHEDKNGIIYDNYSSILSSDVWSSEFDYTIETKSNITYAGIIWGEMFKNGVEDCDWKLNGKDEKDFNFNMPILIGKKKAKLSPFSVLTVICAKYVNEKSTDYKDFITTHNYWLGHY